jgi:uncharacterized protein (DUF488 family)
VVSSKLRIYTIGHSTRSLEELVALLREHGVKRLADIRRFPGSRRYPHFSRDALQRSLPERGIEYIHLPELGGRRKAGAASPNTALQNEQFRAYADHMATDEFRAAVDGLLAGVRPCRPQPAGVSPGGDSDRPGRPIGAGETPALQRTAVMCAEAVPWRCHRNLLSDDLVRRGVEVVHILGRGQAKRHEMSPIARVEGDRVVYPAAQSSLSL